MQQYEIKLDHLSVKNWIDNFVFQSNSNLNNKNLRIVDLYSGCGGMTLGALAASNKNSVNLIVELAIDFDEDSFNVYSDNFSEFSNKIVNDDIKNLFDRRRKNYIKNNTFPKVDILFAGPPCQGHSDLNNSTRRNDERNNLYHYSIKAIERFNPELILLENVSSVIHSKENVVEKTKAYLRKQGYFIKELTINFQNLGIPQKRERHILMGSKKRSFCDSFISNHKSSVVVPLYNFISEYEGSESPDELLLKPTKISRNNTERIEYLFSEGIYNLPNFLRPSCHRDKKHSYNSCYGRLKYDEASQTITSGFGSMGQGRYVHPTKKRTLLAVEAARIQGFPKSFDFKKCSTLTSLRKMIANAVPPQLTYFIVDHYLKQQEFVESKNQVAAFCDHVIS